MNTLTTYLSKKAELERLLTEVSDMENSDELKRDVEFKDRLTELLEEYDKSAKDAFNVLAQIAPSIASGAPQAGVRKPRATITYSNPNTGEVVKTKGGNHKTLKEWRTKYGKETVDSWKS